VGKDVSNPLNLSVVKQKRRDMVLRGGSAFILGKKRMVIHMLLDSHPIWLVICTVSPVANAGGNLSMFFISSMAPRAFA